MSINLKFVWPSLVIALLSGCANTAANNSYQGSQNGMQDLPLRSNDQGIIEIVRQLDELQRELSMIQGKTEDLEYQSQSTQERQRSLYIDLDDRLQDLERSISALNSMNVVDEDEIIIGELPLSLIHI